MLWILPMALALLIAGKVQAHPILQNPMWIEVTPEMMKVRLYVSVRELGVIQGVPISPNGSVSLEMAEETAPRHSQYLLEHLHFRADGLPLGGTVQSITPPEKVGQGAEAPDQAHFVWQLEYPLPQPPPAVLTLQQSMCVEFPSAPGIPWDLSYNYRFGRYGETPKRFGVLPREVEIRYETGFAPVAVVISETSPISFSPFKAGIEYSSKAGGWLLLLAALALNVGFKKDALRLAGAAGAGFAAGFVLKTATGFPFPAWLFPALGGAGVLLTAVDNIHRVRPKTNLRRFLLAAIFSAVQGLAAASAVMESGMENASETFVFALVVLVAGMGVFASGALAVWGISKKLPDQERLRPVVQMLSLVLAAGGVYFLLQGMGINPLAIWKSRVKPQ